MMTVFCRGCKAAIDPSDVFCKVCGADQRPPALQPTPVDPPVVQQPMPQHYQTYEPSPRYEPLPQPSPRLILDEYARQYRTLNWIQFWGWWFLAAYLLGVIMLAYAIIQKPALRRKVAEMGYDPEEWEAPLRKESQLLTIAFLGIMVFLIVGVWLMLGNR